MLAQLMTPTVIRTLTVPCKNGMHMRVAAQIVDCLRPFRSRVWLSTTHLSADARSILSLLHLGARHGATLTLTALGPDAEPAATAVTDLFREHPRVCTASAPSIPLLPPAPPSPPTRPSP
jgi:phosphotransferase system HPr (HPr) family protein